MQETKENVQDGSKIISARLSQHTGPFIKPGLILEGGVQLTSTVHLIPGSNANTQGEYYHHLGDAQHYLDQIIERGLWTDEQAREYAQGYSNCRNALEVLRRNQLLEVITADRVVATITYPKTA